MSLFNLKLFELLEIILNYCFILTNILVIFYSNAKIFYIPAGVFITNIVLHFKIGIFMSHII